MGVAKEDDQVRVHYKCSFTDGTLFHSTFDGDPFEFTLGMNMAVPGFDKAVTGMKKGETKTVSLIPEDAYGHHRDDLLAVVQRAQLPSEIEPKVGMVLEVSSAAHEPIKASIIDVSKDTITLDGNHPLAGKEIVFEIELLDISEKSASQE